MKTTLDLSDHLLIRAKALARERKTTLRSLTEEGLRRVLEDAAGCESTPIRPVTMAGQGLSAEFQGAPWNAIRDAAYGGAGG